MSLPEGVRWKLDVLLSHLQREGLEDEALVLQECLEDLGGYQDEQQNALRQRVTLLLDRWT